MSTRDATHAFESACGTRAFDDRYERLAKLAVVDDTITTVVDAFLQCLHGLGTPKLGHGSPRCSRIVVRTNERHHRECRIAPPHLQCPRVLHLWELGTRSTHT